MRRYHITLGAKTTAGGVVTSATSLCSINGVLMAVEGDTVNCPACKSVGRIMCDGPRLSERWNGKQAALSDDLCICGCHPPPRLLAIQTQKSQLIETEGDDLSPAETQRLAESRRPSSAATEEAVSLRLMDQASREPYRNLPYRLELSSGQVIEGVTDGNGLTRPLTAFERSGLLAWHVTPAAAPA
ncbi:PAAR domain-containing protein [Massilia endophytica]|uniref:PAAR domain-containing protein n=1 Tax=Massilia endophytica TaxID=2899220 RepID=UPI001E2A3062|nr:PAAR domain-containing protein [Massilia endophytica]UGQ47626.1 PAAR domain-containing protein [Massilia endophytica]